MRRVSYEDEKGRMWMVDLPENVPDSDASMGLHVGPPPLESLGLPEDIEIELHNQLFHRGLLTARDLKKRRGEIISALIHSLGVTGRAIIALYLDPPEQPASQPKKEAKPSKKRRTGKSTGGGK